MNDAQEQALLFQFKPFKQIIRVFKVVKHDGNGKPKKTEWFEGYLTGVTNRGLLLNPISEHGESLDPLAASFIAFPQYRNDDIAFVIQKEI